MAHLERVPLEQIDSFRFSLSLYGWLLAQPSQTPSRYIYHHKLQPLLLARADSTHDTSLLLQVNSIMSDKCGNCDCADKSQCVKKGDSYGVVIVDTENSRFEGHVEEFIAENDGKCKCGTSCSCTDCNCGK